MQSILYPPDLLDFAGICDLPAEHKLVVVMLAISPDLTPALIWRLTPFAARAIPLPLATIRGILADLDRRGVAVYSESTGEAYLTGSFGGWHRSPPADPAEDDTPWARQVRTAFARVIDHRVRAAIESDLEFGRAQARRPALLLPANLLTALPARGKGTAWAASEALAAFVLAANPDQTPAGVFRPAGWLDGLSSLASLPPGVFEEVLATLQAAGVGGADDATGEIFVASRLRAARPRDHKRIFEEGQIIASPLIFKLFSRHCKMRKITIQENQWLTSQGRLGEGRLGEDMLGEDRAGLGLVGKTLITRAGERARVRQVGAKIAGQNVPLAVVWQRVQVGELIVDPV